MYYDIQDSSLSVSDVDSYVIIRKLLDSILNMPPAIHALVGKGTDYGRAKRSGQEVVRRCRCNFTLYTLS
jgi:hypothetical protein